MKDVVTLDYPQKEIAVVTLEDRESRNTFSTGIVDGLLKTFETINNNEILRVVVIRGYDNYFCCGGTKNELLDIYSGKLTFTDLAFYRLLLDCPVPTIAAMQGHALGGGLAFACYADVMVLALESFYSANFMKYGFTPGMGATYMLPKKMGEGLGHEMLFSARNYQGVELKARGVSAQIVEKNKVIDVALQMARDLAEKPRLSLTLLKKHLNSDLNNKLQKIIDEELLMHKITFGQPEVKERIEALFL